MQHFYQPGVMTSLTRWCSSHLCRCPGGQTCSGGSWANKYCEVSCVPGLRARQACAAHSAAQPAWLLQCQCCTSQPSLFSVVGRPNLQGGASTCTSSYALAQGQFWEGYMGLLSPVDYDPAINTAEACACKCDQTAGCDIWALPNGVDIGEEVDGCWSLAWDPIEPADPNPDICYGVGQLTIGIKSSYNPTLLDCTQQ